MLLTGAGLFGRTLQNLKNLDPGFLREGVLLADIDGRRAGYRDAALMVFYKELLDQIAHLPGVSSASLSITTPLGDLSLSNDITLKGPGGQEKANPRFNLISPDYFETMRMPLVQGRGFTGQDDNRAPKVAIANEAFVRRYFPGERALGQHISTGADEIEIIGVVKDTIADSLRQAPLPAIYFPYFQRGPQPFNNTLAFNNTMEVRAAGSLSQISTAIRNELQSKLRTAVEVRSLTAQVERTLVQERLMATLAAAFGGLALTLAGVGLYGLLAYSVAGRTRELGIRVALGAERRRILWMVASDGFRLLITGIACGLAAAWAASRLISSMLFGVTATDPFTIAAAAAVLLLAGLAAGFLPARRAATVDPMVALRVE